MMKDVMTNMKERISELKLIGGALCLDFVNTSGWRGDPDSEDTLDDYEDLAAWASHAGALSDAEKDDLSRRSRSERAEAVAVYRRAIALRETLYRAFSALALGRPVDSADLEAINAAVDEAYAHLRLTPASQGFVWAWNGNEHSLELPVWMIARSAADLLLSDRLDRVRQCAGEKCDWLFVDASRNASRRWCDMADCGNREKARRNYARRRDAAGGRQG
jgi:predicted RNA-binding Zn ribbon-like protein